MFCFPNSDHVIFSRARICQFCLFIGYVRICTWMARLFKEAVPSGNVTWSAMGRQHPDNTYKPKKKSIILKGKEFSKAWGHIIKIEVSFLYFSFFILLLFSICNNCFVYLSLFIFLFSVLYSNRALKYRFKVSRTDFSSLYFR